MKLISRRKLSVDFLLKERMADRQADSELDGKLDGSRKE